MRRITRGKIALTAAAVLMAVLIGFERPMMAMSDNSMAIAGEPGNSYVLAATTRTNQVTGNRTVRRTVTHDKNVTIAMSISISIAPSFDRGSGGLISAESLPALRLVR